MEDSMKYKEENEREIIHGHASGGSMNNASITQQNIAGVELTGRVSDPDDRPQVMILRVGQQYHDSREDITVEPIEFYGDKIMIKDGRSCSVTYAEQHWSRV